MAERFESLYPPIVIRDREQDPDYLPNGLRWARTQYEESGFAWSSGIIPRKWKGDSLILEEMLRAMGKGIVKPVDNPKGQRKHSLS